MSVEAESVIWKARSDQATPPPSGMPRLIWEVLCARGFNNDESIQKWLTPSLKNLRDPYTLIDMDKAVARLIKAFTNKEKICIYADYDLDGTSALALLKKGFELLGFEDFIHYQPSRLKEGYGLHNDAIQKIREQDVSLMITVDLGITAVAEVDFAKQIGLDVIVSDHHLPKEELPRAVAVVNPNRSECQAKLGHLCGTGVAFYIVLALRRALLEQNLLTQDFDPKILLDCFAIGTLTDMVPLIEENRVLVKHGLLQLAQTSRPGLRVLLQALDLWGKPLTSQDVAIRFAPKLNALSRMEMGIRPVDLYLIQDENEAQKLVEQVLVNNQSRVASQRGAEEEALQYLRAHPPEHCIWIHSAHFHRGVIGLVANKVSQEYKLPAFVGSVEESGQIVGSVRIPDGLHISALEAMEFAQDQLIQFGGHAAAAGFELKIESAELFGQKLREFFSQRLMVKEPRFWLYDAAATLADLNPAFMGWYEHLSPFGMQFQPPVFYLPQVKVAQVKELKGGHLKLTLSDASSSGIVRTALWFSPDRDHPVLKKINEGLNVAALVEPQWNHFNGQRTLQLLVQDLKLS
jgi:single-stranded-DNA-specific exonuclease